MICGTFCHGHYYAVTSVQLLVSLTAKYDWGNEESLVGLRHLHHPSTSTAASCVTNAGKLWHYRKGHPQGSATLKASQKSSYGFNLGKTMLQYL